MPTAALSLPSRPTRTLGLRITPQQQSELLRLAGRLDCPPSALARLAMCRGLELIEAEHGAA